MHTNCNTFTQNNLYSYPCAECGFSFQSERKYMSRHMCFLLFLKTCTFVSCIVCPLVFHLYCSSWGENSFTFPWLQPHPLHLLSQPFDPFSYTIVEYKVFANISISLLYIIISLIAALILRFIVPEAIQKGHSVF